MASRCPRRNARRTTPFPIRSVCTSAPSRSLLERRSRVIALVAGLAIAAIFAMMSLLGAFVLMPPVTYLAVGLVGVGVTLIVGAFTGRPSGFIAIAAGFGARRRGCQQLVPDLEQLARTRFLLCQRHAIPDLLPR